MTNLPSLPERTMTLRAMKALDPEAYEEYRRAVSLRHYYRTRELKPPKERLPEEERKRRHREYNRERSRRQDVRDRKNAARRAARAANPEKTREDNNRWRAAHPEWAAAFNRLNQSRRRAARSAAQAANISVAELNARLSMWSGCWICHGLATQVDHVKPISRGGPHLLANLRPICATCNKRKGNQWPLSIGHLIDSSTLMSAPADSMSLAS